MYTSHSTSGCHVCSFAKFCLAEENVEQNRHDQHLVKQFRTLKRNETLSSNPSFQNLYVVQKGILKTYHVEPTGKEVIRGFYFAGEILGWEAIHMNSYPYSIVTLSDTLVCEIPYQRFLTLLSSQPDLQKRILDLISQQLNVGSYLAATFAEQRLAAFLLDVSTRLHSRLQLKFVLPMSRQNIGNYLRMTGETISRIFSRMHKNKIIEVNNKKVKVLELEKLQQLANGLLMI